MTRIYLVRHGETEYNKKGCYYGWTDCSLSALGMVQNEALKTAFDNISVDVIFSSDLKRAQETAKGIWNREPVQDDRLRELNFGLWEGRHHQEIMENSEDSWALWTSDWQNAAPPEGESFMEMYGRVSKCMDEMLKQHENKNIAIVAHNGTLRIIAAYLLKLPHDKVWCFGFDQGKYSVFERNDSHCCIKAINTI